MKWNEMVIQSDYQDTANPKGATSIISRTEYNKYDHLVKKGCDCLINSRTLNEFSQGHAPFYSTSQFDYDFF